MIVITEPKYQANEMSGRTSREAALALCVSYLSCISFAARLARLVCECPVLAVSSNRDVVQALSETCNFDEQWKCRL